MLTALGSVRVGSFLLAEAGLLNGKRATTHLKFGRELVSRYPQVNVKFDPIWARDGNIYASAGISAGIDLALAWVEEAQTIDARRLFHSLAFGAPAVARSCHTRTSEVCIRSAFAVVVPCLLASDQRRVIQGGILDTEKK
jgi:putative intracellular protease/amidase